jgi:hypothetical protein
VIVLVPLSPFLIFGNGLNGLNVWNYLNAQVGAEGNQK